MTPDKRLKTVSLIVPVYNESDALAFFFAAVDDVAKKLAQRGVSLEIVFVDDGSFDDTASIILTEPVKNYDICLVKLSRNFRKDNALAAGFAQAKGDAVIPMDVDLQDPPEAILAMVDAWEGGAKVVNAKRSSRDQDSFFKRQTSRYFYKLFNRLSDYPIDPDVGDFRLLDRQVVDVINQMPERVRFMKGMFAWVGFKPVTIEYDRPDRSAGETKWNFWKLWNFALDGITGSSTLPLRAWTYFGLYIAAIAVIAAVLLITRTLIFGIDVPGYASLMVVTLFMGACQLIALGVLGEYVGRLSLETKQRPIYVIEDVIERTRT